MTRTLIVFTSRYHTPRSVANLVNVLRNGATIRYIRVGQYWLGSRLVYGYIFTLTTPSLIGYQSDHASRVRTIDGPLRANAALLGISYAGINLSS